MSLFIKTDQGKQLKVSKCTKCNRIYFPVRHNCPDCLDSKVQEVPLSKRGKLYSYSITHMKPLVKGVVDPPYANGIIEFPEGFKLFAILRDIEPMDDASMQKRIGTEFEILSEATICKTCKIRYFPAVLECPKCGADGQIEEIKNNYFVFVPVKN